MAYRRRRQFCRQLTGPRVNPGTGGELLTRPVMSQEKIAQSISPNYTSEKLEDPSIEDKIDVFEDRMKGWLFAPMKKLLGQPHDRIASLCLQTTYFEGIWSYLVGKKSQGHSKEFFINGFYDVFKITRQHEGLLKKAAQILLEGLLGEL